MTHRTPLADRNVAVYFLALLTGDFAVQMQSVAIGWHVFTLRHQAFDLGLVGLVLFLPTFGLAPLSGLVADRWNRRTIVLLATAIEALCSLGFFALVARDTRTLAPYLGILIVVGTARAFAAPAERSLLVNIVPADRFVRTSAAFSALREIAIVAGPALGGALVAIGTQIAFASTAAVLAISFVALTILRTPRSGTSGLAFDLRGAVAGMRFILSRPTICGAISLDLVAVLFGGATALLPVYADAILHVGPIGLGILRSAPAIGAGLSAAYLTRRPPRTRIGRTLFGAVATFGAATLVFAFSRSFVLSLIALAVAGAADMISVVIRVGLVQLNTPDVMRGRVSAAEAVFIGASNELGEFESGMLAALVGSVAAVAAGGIAAVVFVGLWALLFPQLRGANALAPPAPADLAGSFPGGAE